MTKAKKGVISPGELHFYLIVGTAWAMSMLLLSSWLQQTFPEKATAPADESGVTKSQEFSVAKVQYDEVLYTQKLARVDTAITHLVRRHEDACRGKEQLLRVFLSHDILKADPSLCGQLPSTEQVAKLYGERPIILGLDSCNAYRTMLNGEVAKPRVSGLYNSGTSALQMFFARNSQLLGDDPTRSVWTVPWGKHVPPKHRFRNRSPVWNEDPKTGTLPIVIVRDPYRWMISMCKENYDAHWEGDDSGRCPKLVRNNTNETFQVGVNIQQSLYMIQDNYTSLADMWSEWNRQYLEADFPRLMIRYEDYLFRTDEVMEKVFECVGVPVNKINFRYLINPAKSHGSSANFATALIQFSSEEGRYRGLTKEDRVYLERALDPALMSIFGYKLGPREVDPKDLEGEFYRSQRMETNPDPIISHVEAGGKRPFIHAVRISVG